MRRLVANPVLAGIRLYQLLISPLFPPCCRFQPTCSRYAYDAVARFGVRRGGWLTLKRIVRCHPFYYGSLIDPVPAAGAPGKDVAEYG